MLISQTQRASRFKDLCPPDRLTQFHSLLPRHELMDLLVGALQEQHVSIPNLSDVEDVSGDIRLPIHHIDKRKCPLQGEIRIMRYNNQGVSVVKFIKSRGDPLEFRRFFKVSEILLISNFYRVPPSFAGMLFISHKINIFRRIRMTFIDRH
jgi:serine/threonine-protein kinase CHEK1